ILRLVRLDHAIDLDIRAADTFELLDGHCQHLRPAAAKQIRRVTEFQLHADAIALYLDRTDASGTDRVLIQVRIGVLTQYGFHSFTGDGHDNSHKKDRAKQEAMLPAAAS